MPLVHHYKKSSHPHKSSKQNNSTEHSDREHHHDPLDQSSASKKKAKLTHIQSILMKKGHRTRVPEYLFTKNYIKNKLQRDPHYKYRLISRSYIRKLSEQVNPHESRNERKISWSDQIQVVFFDKKKNPETISRQQRLKESMQSQQASAQ